jgi:F-type H+-transporting ATPase subunit delta
MAEKVTIARPYAQAVFDIANSKGALKEWSGKLALLTAVVSDPQLQRLLGNPQIGAERLIDIIVSVCGDKLDKEGASLVRVLAENRRLDILPELTGLYEGLRAEAEKTVQAELTSAYPLTDEQKASISAALRKRLGREVQLSCATDESLIGGAIIRAGDLVIDGSVAAHVSRLATALSR